MARRDLRNRLAILAAPTVDDASCAVPAATTPRNPAALGIRVTQSPDGRTVPMLAVLMTNRCMHDCSHCVHRRSNQTPRASLSVEEMVRLTLELHQRGYIQGLILGSAVPHDPDDTMAALVEVARTLRETHAFGGTIEIKTAAGSSPSLLDTAILHVDRLHINVEPSTYDAVAASAEVAVASMVSDVDDKLGWALQNRAFFPVDVNTAPREVLLQVPGIGPRVVDRILSARRFRPLDLGDLRRLKVAMKRAAPFILSPTATPAAATEDAQLCLFDVHTGGKR